MNGGYTTEEKVNGPSKWIEITFTEEEKEKIRQYLKYHPNSSSTTIRDALFKDIPILGKDNAAWNIQVVLGRAYSGR